MVRKKKAEKMTLTIEGVYTQGKVELLEIPQGVKEGRVRVTLTQEDTAIAPRYLVRGKYKGERMSTLEGFADAEWHGEEEFDIQHGR